jgi:hypothetical protein
MMMIIINYNSQFENNQYIHRLFNLIFFQPEFLQKYQVLSFSSLNDKTG